MNKQIVYLISFVVCIFLQMGIAPAIQIGGAMPCFLLIPVLLVSLNSGAGAGGVAGFFCGLLFDLFGEGTVGCMALVFTIVALAAGFVGANLDSRSVLVTCIIAVVASLFAEVAYGIVAMFANTESSGAVGAMVSSALPSALYTAVFSCIALITIQLVMVDDSAPMQPRLGSPIGGSAPKGSRMKSRLK